MTNDFVMASKPQEELAVFHARFSRSYRLLYFIACRVLGGPERAEDAVRSCWLTASRSPPQFEHESAFRGWLLRVLIEEVLAFLRKRRQAEPKEERGQIQRRRYLESPSGGFR